MSIRRTKGSLQVETQVFAKNGRKVVLCGVMHIAEPSFWGYVNELVKGAEARGHEIQYEGVKNDMGRIVHLGPNIGPIAEAVGLQGQHDGLKYGTDWVCSDIKLTELLQGVSTEKLAKVEADSVETSKTFKDILAGPEGKSAAKFVRWVLGYVHILSKFPSGTFGIRRSVILGRRNASAYEAIKSTPKNVTTIWGAAHLPGIGKMLRADGYKLSGSTWVTVVGPTA